MSSRAQDSPSQQRVTQPQMSVVQRLRKQDPEELFEEARTKAKLKLESWLCAACHDQS